MNLNLKIKSLKTIRKLLKKSILVDLEKLAGLGIDAIIIILNLTGNIGKLLLIQGNEGEEIIEVKREITIIEEIENMMIKENLI